MAEADIDPPVSVPEPADAEVVELSGDEVTADADPVVAEPEEELSVVELPPLQPTAKASTRTRDSRDRVTGSVTATALNFPGSGFA